MHVGLNLLFLVPGETGGMEVYARELIPALRAADPGLRLTAFVNRETLADAGPWDEGDVVGVPITATNRVEWVRGEQLLLPRLARRAGVDLVHSLASTAPAVTRARRVVTIHDLHYRVVPDSHFGMRGLGMRVLVPLAARRAHRVIVDSEATARDVRRFLKIAPGRLDVVPLGVGAPAVAAEVEHEHVLRERHGLGSRRVILSASAKRPHKNLLRLLDACARLPAGQRPVLVLPGYPTPHEAELRERATQLGIAGDVRFLGWVEAAELEGLYALASMFVFPSLHEGFGLPVLEAMRRGVPVACSDRSSLPEVAGSAALLFDPEDPAAIAASMARVLDDPAEARRLREAGITQAARFSWERTARATLESYRAALAP